MPEIKSRINSLIRSRIFRYFSLIFFAGLVIQFLAILSLTQTVRFSDDSATFNKNFARFANYGLKVSALAPHRWVEKGLPGNSKPTRMLKMAESASRALAANPELLELILESKNRRDLLTSNNLFAIADLSIEVRSELNQIEALAIGEAGDKKIESIFGYEIFPLIQSANSALDFALLVPDLFGCGKPAEVLLLLTSAAEARSVGGLIGQYLQIDFNCGSFSVSQVGANTDLRDNEIFSQHLERYSGLYSGTNSEWVNSNLIFDLDNLAPAWANAYNQQFNADIDFVAVVDTELLSVLLALDGGISAADGTKLNSVEEVNAYLQNGVYYQFADNQIARKEHLKQITEKFADNLTLDKLLNIEMFSSYFEALKQNRILIYPTASHLKNKLMELHSLSWSDRKQNTIFVGVNNLSGSKFDFYSTRKITLEKCNENQAQILVEISNTAELSASYPDYVNRRLDGYPNQGTGVLNEVIFMVPTGQLEFEILKTPSFSSGNWALSNSGYDIYRVIEFISAGEVTEFKFIAKSKIESPFYLRSWGVTTKQSDLGKNPRSRCS